MDAAGRFLGNHQFQTSEKQLVNAFEMVKAKHKHLVIEEGPLTRWAAQVASAYVERVVTCDSRENALIYKSSSKRDRLDTEKLCRLLRLGELKHVYQPESDHRAIFKARRGCIDLRHQLIATTEDRAVFATGGIDCFGARLYSVKGREGYLQQIPHGVVQHQLLRLYELMDSHVQAKESAKTELKALGRRYPEICEFKKISGIGALNACLFDAFIQTPHRFGTKRQLQRYCRLGVTERSSDGKPLGYQRLDRSGIGELKAISFRTFVASMRGDNEVKRFYQQSLSRTHNKVHARLNTQRKVVSVMYGLWKKGGPYRPDLFLDPSA
jgi:transposase